MNNNVGNNDPEENNKTEPKGKKIEASSEGEKIDETTEEPSKQNAGIETNTNASSEPLDSSDSNTETIKDSPIISDTNQPTDSKKDVSKLDQEHDNEEKNQTELKGGDESTPSSQNDKNSTGGSFLQSLGSVGNILPFQVRKSKPEDLSPQDQIEAAINETKQNVPKFYSKTNFSEKTRFQKFRIATYKSLSLSLIPLLIILIGLSFNLHAIQGTVFVDNTRQYSTNSIQYSNKLATQLNNEYSSFISSIESEFRNLKFNIASDPTTYDIQSFSVNETGATPNPQFSTKYNKIVDYSVSAWQLLAKHNRTKSVNDTVQLTAQFDPYFMTTYNKVKEILWIRLILDNGVVRTYPHLPDNSSNTNFQALQWFNKTKSAFSFDTFVTGLEVDNITSKLIYSITSPYFKNGIKLGVLQASIDVVELKQQFNLLKGKGITPFLMTKAGQGVYHPKLSLKQFGWNNNELNQSILKIDPVINEINRTKNIIGLTNQLNGSVSVNTVGVTYWIFPITNTGQVLGLYLELSTTPVKSQFDSFQLLALPIGVAVILLVSIVGLQLQSGLIKIDNLEKSLKRFRRATKIEGISNRLRDTLTQMSTENIIDKTGSRAEKLIKEKGKDARENVEGEISRGLEKVSSNIDKGKSMILEEEDTNLVEVIEKDKILTKILESLEENPYLFLQNRIKMKNINIEDIKNENYSSLKSLVTGAEKLLIALIVGRRIDIAKISDSCEMNGEQLSGFFTSLPLNLGITLSEDQKSIMVEQKLLLENIESFTLYFNKFLKNPKKYLKLSTSNNVEKIDKVKSQIEKFYSTIQERNSISLDELSEIFQLHKKQIIEIFSQLSSDKKFGINLEEKTLSIDEDKFKSNLLDFVKKFTLIVVTRYSFISA